MPDCFFSPKKMKFDLCIPKFVLPKNPLSRDGSDRDNEISYGRPYWFIQAFSGGPFASCSHDKSTDCIEVSHQ